MLPIDPVLRVFQADGTLLRETDDSNAKPDPVFDVNVEAAGFFEAEVRDRFRRPEMTYQLSSSQGHSILSRHRDPRRRRPSPGRPSTSPSH